MGAPMRAALPRGADVLSQRPAARADTVEEAHATVSRVFCEHRLAPLERGEVRMTLRSAHDSGVGIDLLDYGEAVSINVPRGLESFHLVQIPLRGRATLEAGHAFVDSSPSVATVPPLDRDFRMRWDAGAPTLILYADRERLQAVAHAMYGVDADRLELALQLRLDTREGSDFVRALVEHHEVLERHTSDGTYARRLSAELLLTRLLTAVENSVSRSLGVWSAAPETSAAHPDHLVKRFEAALEEGVAQGVGVVELAQQLGVPLRTLQSHVRAARETTPTALLRDAQLRRARELLEAADPLRDTVTAIAQRAGFSHLGRFSIEYRRRFGETPGETLKR
ncbi:AraC family transcriptional regulator [Leucobacter sp. USHLN153]|uniref:AraC family transcriptional regulator n=1 Tax=Leucobacter sp. USHLN153 TaxID=3081268 RepID=UPI003018CA6B